MCDGADTAFGGARTHLTLLKALKVALQEKQEEDAVLFREIIHGETLEKPGAAQTSSEPLLSVWIKCLNTVHTNTYVLIH